MFAGGGEIRATYGTVGEVIGEKVERNVHHHLPGPRRAELSWIVNAETGLPTKYKSRQMHPHLLVTPHIIRDPNELRRICGLARRD